MIPERIRAQIGAPSDGDCWPWIGACDRDNYGIVWFEGRCSLAHRVVYLVTRGPIPDHMDVDHLCRNRVCVNPGHLRLLTRAENRSDNGHSSKTHCPRGHPYDETNTYTRRQHRNGISWIGRHCRTCNREAQRLYRAKKET